MPLNKTETDTTEEQLNRDLENARFNTSAEQEFPALKKSETEKRLEVSRPDSEKPGLPTKRPAPVNRQTFNIPSKDQTLQKIEKIMEQDLSEPYSRLSPIAKEEFKIKGEQTAEKINELLKSSRIKVKKIFQLLIEWLRMLPGINKFFLEQEAKIKTDRILEINQSLKDGRK